MKIVLKTLTTLFCCCLLIWLTAGCATDKAVVEQAEQFNTTLDKAVIHDPQLESYFNRLGTRIIAGAKAYDAESEQAERERWQSGDIVEY